MNVLASRHIPRSAAVRPMSFLHRPTATLFSPKTKWERSNGIYQSHARSRKIPFPRHSQVDQGGCEGVHLSVASAIVCSCGNVESVTRERG